MADETPEQISAHRDQLKAENDTFNPLLDAARKSISELTEQLRASNEIIATLKHGDEEKTSRIAGLERKIDQIRSIVG